MKTKQARKGGKQEEATECRRRKAPGWKGLLKLMTPEGEGHRERKQERTAIIHQLRGHLVNQSGHLLFPAGFLCWNGQNSFNHIHSRLR